MSEEQRDAPAASSPALVEDLRDAGLSPTEVLHRASSNLGRFAQLVAAGVDPKEAARRVREESGPKVVGRR